MDTDSEETVSFVQGKLRDCDEHHAFCAASRPISSWYPTRLIDLRPLGNEGARLIITSEDQAGGP